MLFALIIVMFSLVHSGIVAEYLDGSCFLNSNLARRVHKEDWNIFDLLLYVIYYHNLFA